MIVPLAYTASSWGLLTVTSKAIMLVILAASVPEHIAAARTFWGIYCPNKGRVEDMAVPLPVVVATVTLVPSELTVGCQVGALASVGK